MDYGNNNFTDYQDDEYSYYNDEDGNILIYDRNGDLVMYEENQNNMFIPDNGVTPEVTPQMTTEVTPQMTTEVTPEELNMNINLNGKNLFDLLIDYNDYIKKGDNLSEIDIQNKDYTKILIKENINLYIEDPKKLDMNKYLNDVISNLSSNINNLNNEISNFRENKVIYNNEIINNNNEIYKLNEMLQQLSGMLNQQDVFQISKNIYSLENKNNDLINYINKVNPRINNNIEKISKIKKELDEFKTLGELKVSNFMIYVLNKLAKEYYFEGDFTESIKNLIKIIEDKIDNEIEKRSVDQRAERLLIFGKREVPSLLDKLKRGDYSVLSKNKDLLLIKSDSGESMIDYLIEIENIDIIKDLLKSNNNLESKLEEYLYDNIENAAMVKLLKPETLLGIFDRELKNIKIELSRGTIPDILKFLKLYGLLFSIEQESLGRDREDVERSLFIINKTKEFKKYLDDVYDRVSNVYFLSNNKVDKILKYIYLYENTEYEDKIFNLIKNIGDYVDEEDDLCEILKKILGKRKNEELYKILNCRF